MFVFLSCPEFPRDSKKKKKKKKKKKYDPKSAIGVRVIEILLFCIIDTYLAMEQWTKIHEQNIQNKKVFQPESIQST